MAYRKPDVTVERANQEGTPLIRGGDVVPVVICQSFGADTAETNENVTRTVGVVVGSPSFQDILAKASESSPLQDLVKVGNTAGASDYVIGSDCRVLAPNYIDWSGAPNMVPPTLDTPSYSAGGAVDAASYEYRATVKDQSYATASGTDGVWDPDVPTEFTTSGLVPNAWSGAVLRITDTGVDKAGSLIGQEVRVSSNSATVLTLDSGFDVPSGTTDSYSSIAYTLILGESTSSISSTAEIDVGTDNQTVRSAFANVLLATGYNIYRNVVDSGVVASSTSTTLVGTGVTWTVGMFSGGTVTISSGTGSGQSRTILNNSDTTLFVSQAWSVTPSTDSQYEINGPFSYTRVTGTGATTSATTDSLTDATQTWTINQWEGAYLYIIESTTGTEDVGGIILSNTADTIVITDGIILVDGTATRYAIVTRPQSVTKLDITLSVSDTYFEDVGDALVDGVPPTINTAFRRPGDSDEYYASYTYKAFSYNTPERYYTTAQVYAKHGVGSEAANAARLILGKSGQGNGAKVMEIVIPSSTDPQSYVNALITLESRGKNEQYCIVILKRSDQILESLISHCDKMSEKDIKRYRRFIWSHPYGATVAEIVNDLPKMQNTMRGMYVAMDGGTPVIEAWENPSGYISDSGTAKTPYTVLTIADSTKSWTVNAFAGGRVRITRGTGVGQTRYVKSNTSTVLTVTEPWTTTPDDTSEYEVRLTSRYTLKKPVDGLWCAVATAGLVAALPDTATPLTRKTLVGVDTDATVTWTDAEMDAIATAGGAVLVSKAGEIEVRHGITANLDTVENEEWSVVQAEDSMKIALDGGLESYIGSKLTNDVKAGVTNTVIRVLNDQVRREVIRAFDPSTLEVVESPGDPTELLITYTYSPVYPLNRITVTYTFNLAGVTL